MEQYIKKSALVAEIESYKNSFCDRNGYLEDSETNGLAYDTLCELEDSIDTLEVKGVDLDLITSWFDHIAQIADDRMTATNQRMTDAHALDEIKCLAKNSSEFITKHYKAQKGE